MISTSVHSSLFTNPLTFFQLDPAVTGYRVPSCTGQLNTLTFTPTATLEPNTHVSGREVKVSAPLCMIALHQVLVQHSISFLMKQTHPELCASVRAKKTKRETLMTTKEVKVKMCGRTLVSVCSCFCLRIIRGLLWSAFGGGCQL